MSTNDALRLHCKNMGGKYSYLFFRLWKCDIGDLAHQLNTDQTEPEEAAHEPQCETDSKGRALKDVLSCACFDVSHVANCQLMTPA